MRCHGSFILALMQERYYRAMQTHLNKPHTIVKGQNELLHSTLAGLVQKDGAFDTLMELVRGGDKEIRASLATLIDSEHPDFDRLFGHHGLGGEFGNSIGSVLMNMSELGRGQVWSPERLASNAARMRHCWSDKLSKATEYTTRAETSGAAMKRFSQDIRAYAVAHTNDQRLLGEIFAKLDRYDNALEQIGQAVEMVKSIVKPVALAPEPQQGVSPQ